MGGSNLGEALFKFADTDYSTYQYIPETCGLRQVNINTMSYEFQVLETSAMLLASARAQSVASLMMDVSARRSSATLLSGTCDVAE